LSEVLGKGIEREYNLYDLLKRPEVRYESLLQLVSVDQERILQDNPELDEELRHQVEIEVKYAGYVTRQKIEIERQAGFENQPIPEDMDYSLVKGLSNEALAKFNAAKPTTVGQASRISGITPAAVSLLLVYLKRHSLAKHLSKQS
jgi:tRNA uridine 5-carboxymethylaminomethyl modification enzyme